MDFKTMNLDDIIKQNGKILSLKQFKDLRKNSLCIWNYYIGKNKLGNPMYNIKLIDRNEIDIYLNYTN